jgi:NADH:ubiquinone oxidoreductase subunit
MSFLFSLQAALSGRKVGTDRFGNRYYESRADMPGGYGRKRRWAIYAKGGTEPTVVPPEWHAWLHHTTDAPLDEKKRFPWQEEHRPNPTGTVAAYRPAGHDYMGGQRQASGADYQAWTPGQ